MSLRAVTICLVILFALLAVAPFMLYGQMSRDAVEPQKITLGAGALLGLFHIAASAISVLLLVAAVIAFRRKDRGTLVIALPAPCLALIAVCLLWLDGM